MTPEDRRKAWDKWKDQAIIFRTVIIRKTFRAPLKTLITGKQDLILTREETQKDLKRLLSARSLCLDVHGIDSENRRYDTDVQRADSGARLERARYHSAAMDIEALNAGQEFEELPETYTIFVTENDFFGKGVGLYPIERMNLATQSPINDREHILYLSVLPAAISPRWIPGRGRRWQRLPGGAPWQSVPYTHPGGV